MTDDHLRELAAIRASLDAPTQWGATWMCTNCALDLDEPYCWACGKALSPSAPLEVAGFDRLAAGRSPATSSGGETPLGAEIGSPAALIQTDRDPGRSSSQDEPGVAEEVSLDAWKETHGDRRRGSSTIPTVRRARLG